MPWDGVSEVVARRALLNERYCHSILSQVDQPWHKRIICYYTSVWCPEEDLNLHALTSTST